MTTESTVAAMKKLLFATFPLLLLLCVLMIGVVDAAAQTFTVSAGKKVIKTIDLEGGDVVSGRISVVGGTDNKIKFFVTDPTGKVLLRFEEASATNFGFTASRTGTYSLHFDNALSDSDKTVSMNYEVQRYIMGMPQEYFYVFVIMFIGLVGVIIFIALARA